MLRPGGARVLVGLGDLDHFFDGERRPGDFTNGPIPVLGSDEQLAMRERDGAEIRTLIHMDKPDHTKYRKLTVDWFKPASVRRLTEALHCYRGALLIASHDVPFLRGLGLTRWLRLEATLDETDPE